MNRLRHRKPLHPKRASRAVGACVCPDYEQTFLCDHDVRHRSNLYASEEIKRKLLDVVQLLGRGNLSLTAYVDNILRHHLEYYREEINRLHKQRNSQNIL